MRVKRGRFSPEIQKIIDEAVGAGCTWELTSKRHIRIKVPYAGVVHIGASGRGTEPAGVYNARRDLRQQLAVSRAARPQSVIHGLDIPIGITKTPPPIVTPKAVPAPAAQETVEVKPITPEPPAEKVVTMTASKTSPIDQPRARSTQSNAVKMAMWMQNMGQEKVSKSTLTSLAREFGARLQEPVAVSTIRNVLDGMGWKAKDATNGSVVKKRALAILAKHLSEVMETLGGVPDDLKELCELLED